jgi:hypothetical protein
MVVPDPVHRFGGVAINAAGKRGLMSTFIWIYRATGSRRR